jgi:hypothetical protein
VQQTVPGASRKGRCKPIGQRIGQQRRIRFRAKLEMPLGRQLHGEGHAARLPAGMRETLFISDSPKWAAHLRIMWLTGLRGEDQELDAAVVGNA